MLDLQKPLDIALSAAMTAGDRVLELKRNNCIEPVQVSRQVISFENGHPIGEPYTRTLTKTSADILSHETIIKMLRAEFSEFPVLSEEEYIKVGNIPDGTPYFIVDPIDGTIHLEKDSNQWTINIALCVSGEPLIGIVVIPAENKVYLGSKGSASQWSFCDKIQTKYDLQIESRERNELIVSKCAPLDLGGADDPITSVIMAANGLHAMHMSGSAYRYIEIATGAIDLIVHGAGNFLWDKAAAQVVIEGTGGQLINLPWDSVQPSDDTCTVDIKHGAPMTYQRTPLKDEGHIVLSKNSMEQLSRLSIPKNLDSRKLWKFVIT